MATESFSQLSSSMACFLVWVQWTWSDHVHCIPLHPSGDSIWDHLWQNCCEWENSSIIHKKYSGLGQDCQRSSSSLEKTICLLGYEPQIRRVETAFVSNSKTSPGLIMCFLFSDKFSYQMLQNCKSFKWKKKKKRIYIIHFKSIYFCHRSPKYS